MLILGKASAGIEADFKLLYHISLPQTFILICLKTEDRRCLNLKKRYTHSS